MIIRFDPAPEELQRYYVGPVGPHVKSFAALISQLGYCQANGWQKIELAADLSRWLERMRIRLRQLDERQTDIFLQARWERVSWRSGDQATMSQLLRHLRQSHVIPIPAPTLRNDLDLLEHEYGSFLTQERALTPASIKQYGIVVRRFLSHCFPSGKARLKKLCPKDVTDFVLHDTSNRGRRSAQLMATVLRSFLSFLLQHGRIITNLATAIPKVAGWRL
jgi:integrase/recombinase XerD